jgi:hypothetical protein
MMKKDRDKMNLRILGMLRQRGAPSLTPFPGEQGFESEDVDLDQTGDVVAADATGGLSSTERRKKKRRPEEFVAAEESVNLIGKP